MPEEEEVDIKLRLYDGTEIGPLRCPSSSTILTLKDSLISLWPKGKSVVPKVANEIKLINFGKILENNKTVGQCRAPFDDLAGVMVMHVVVQPSPVKTKADKKVEESKKFLCSCSVM